MTLIMDLKPESSDLQVLGNEISKTFPRSEEIKLHNQFLYFFMQKNGFRDFLPEH